MVHSEIAQLLKPTIQEMGYELWGCEYLVQGRHSLLRIYIDREEGIGIDDCERVSRRVGSLLDVENPIKGHYSLEVSSPGIPKPLFFNWQYQRYIGQEIQIKLVKPVAGKRKFSGTIVSINDHILVLKLEHDQQEFLFSNIVKANLTV